MQDAATPLSDDVTTLHALIHEQAATIQQQQRELDQVRHRLDQLLRRLFGPRSEKLSLRYISLDCSAPQWVCRTSLR